MNAPAPTFDASLVVAVLLALLALFGIGAVLRPEFRNGQMPDRPVTYAIGMATFWVCFSVLQLTRGFPLSPLQVILDAACVIAACGAASLLLILLLGKPREVDHRSALAAIERETEEKLRALTSNGN